MSVSGGHQFLPVGFDLLMNDDGFPYGLGVTIRFKRYSNDFPRVEFAQFIRGLIQYNIGTTNAGFLDF